MSLEQLVLVVLARSWWDRRRAGPFLCHVSCSFSPHACQEVFGGGGRLVTADPFQRRQRERVLGHELDAPVAHPQAGFRHAHRKQFPHPGEIHLSILDQPETTTNMNDRCMRHSLSSTYPLNDSPRHPTSRQVRVIRPVATILHENQHRLVGPSTVEWVGQAFASVGLSGVEPAVARRIEALYACESARTDVTTLGAQVGGVPQLQLHRIARRNMVVGIMFPERGSGRDHARLADAHQQTTSINQRYSALGGMRFGISR